MVRLTQSFPVIIVSIYFRRSSSIDLSVQVTHSTRTEVHQSLVTVLKNLYIPCRTRPQTVTMSYHTRPITYKQVLHIPVYFLRQDIENKIRVPLEGGCVSSSFVLCRPPTLHKNRLGPSSRPPHSSMYFHSVYSYFQILSDQTCKTGILVPVTNSIITVKQYDRVLSVTI